jgi:hypothetical protein
MAGHTMSKELNELIREVAERLPNADPHVIADEVARLTPTKILRASYAESLVGMVRNMLSGQRSAALGAALNRSRPVERRREWWSKLLAARLHVGDAQWMPLGDCGRAELKFAIGERETDIERVQAQIDYLSTLIELLDTYGVETVGALPPDCLPPEGLAA